MEQVLKVFFKHQTAYYSAYVTIVHQFDTDFIFVELLDEDMIADFNTSYLSYAGENGYRKLDAYYSVYLRPVLCRIGSLIRYAQNLHQAQQGEVANESYARQN
jgi:hypothetical protein